MTVDSQTINRASTPESENRLSIAALAKLKSTATSIETRHRRYSDAMGQEIALLDRLLPAYLSGSPDVQGELMTVGRRLADLVETGPHLSALLDDSPASFSNVYVEPLELPNIVDVEETAKAEKLQAWIDQASESELEGLRASMAVGGVSW